MKTLGEKILARLRNFRQAKNSWHVPALQPGDSVSCIEEEEANGYQLRLEFDDADKLSLQARRVLVSKPTRPTPAAFNAGRLRRQAEELARRVTYLTEEIRLVEIDLLNQRAQLRSASPLRDETGVSYFEILMTGNHALSLSRYQANDHDTTSRRAEIAFVISKEIFERLVNDFVEALGIS